MRGGIHHSQSEAVALGGLENLGELFSGSLHENQVIPLPCSPPGPGTPLRVQVHQGDPFPKLEGDDGQVNGERGFPVPPF